MSTFFYMFMNFPGFGILLSKITTFLYNWRKLSLFLHFDELYKMLILIRLDDEDFSSDSGIEKLTQLWEDVFTIEPKVNRMASEFKSCFEVSNRNKVETFFDNKVKYIEPDSKYLIVFYFFIIKSVRLRDLSMVWYIILVVKNCVLKLMIIIFNLSFREMI